VFLDVEMYPPKNIFTLLGKKIDRIDGDD